MNLSESLGHVVSGSDRDLIGHDPQNVIGADLVVYTNAVKNDNCELSEAKKLGIKTVERAKFLAELSRLYDKCVAVAGCHGKSTATAMTGAALASLYPTVHVGASGASKIGGKDIFITEACEYNKSFHFLSPDIGVVLNVAYDHPDFYKTERALKNAYLKFIKNSAASLVNGDDLFLKKIDCLNFGLNENNYYRAENISNKGGLYSFDFTADGKTLTRVRLPVHGRHNMYNALAALSVSHMLGVEADKAASEIERFKGIARRFELLGTFHGKVVYSDYAHHPDEIKATISAAHEIHKTVTVVFQPHTYSRTAALFKEEAAALIGAESVILAPIFAAREMNTDGISSDLIADEMFMLGKRAECALSLEDAAESARLTNDEAVIFMGAGDITEAADKFMTKN